MGIQFAVHTYGHFDAMFYVLNGIKMIMNSGFMDSMIKLMALVTTSYYSLRGIATAAQGGTGHYFLKTNRDVNTDYFSAHPKSRHVSGRSY